MNFAWLTFILISMKKQNYTKVVALEQRTVQVKPCANMYGIPLWTFRKWVSQDKIPGILRKQGGRRVYIDLSKFDPWWREQAEGAGEGSE